MLKKKFDEIFESARYTMVLLLRLSLSRSRVVSTACVGFTGVASMIGPGSSSDMQKGAVLKKKFDEIFESARYTKVSIAVRWYSRYHTCPDLFTRRKQQLTHKRAVGPCRRVRCSRRSSMNP